MLSQKEQRRIRKLINKAVSKATNIKSLRCSLGHHKFKKVAQSGKKLDKIYYYVCKRCGLFEYNRIEREI